MYKFAVIGLVLVFLPVSSFGLLESAHPYPNNSDETQTSFQRGALGLEIQFSPETCTEPEHDYIIISDDDGRVIGTYSGNALAGLRILVEGDTVRIRLVSDDAITGYGYKVSEIRAIFAEDYFKPCELEYGRANFLADEGLKEELYNLVKDHVCLGYTPARQKMFSEIDNEGGYVRCVYTGRWVQTNGIPDPLDMNTEHTWPQSKGAKYDPAKSDLYHLFPTDTATNEKRASNPFGRVVVEHWTKGGSSLGLDSEGRLVFSPRTDHRGNAARTIFYFAIRYRKEIPDFEENVLRAWHEEDPVDGKEQARNNAISGYQKNRNPFIDHPEYVQRIDNF